MKNYTSRFKVVLTGTGLIDGKNKLDADCKVRTIVGSAINNEIELRNKHPEILFPTKELFDDDNIKIKVYLREVKVKGDERNE